MYPGLPVARTKRVEKAQAFFIVRHCPGIIAQRLMHRAAIIQCPGISLFIEQAPKNSQRKLEMPERVIIIAMTATDLAQYRLHPGYTPGVIGLAKQLDGLLRVLTGLRVLTFFAEQQRKFKERPGFFIALVLMAMQRKAAREATQRLWIFTQLTQDRAQAVLHLPFT